MVPRRDLHRLQAFQRARPPVVLALGRRSRVSGVECATVRDIEIDRRRRRDGTRGDAARAGRLLQVPQSCRRRHHARGRGSGGGSVGIRDRERHALRRRRNDAGSGARAAWIAERARRGDV